MLAMIISSTWQIQNVHGHRDGLALLSANQVEGGRGPSCFSHMKQISWHLCAAVWVGLFYSKVGVVRIYTWLFIALIYYKCVRRKMRESKLRFLSSIAKLPSFLSLFSLLINLIRVWSQSSSSLFHWLPLVNIQSNSVFLQSIFGHKLVRSGIAAKSVSWIVLPLENWTLMSPNSPQKLRHLKEGGLVLFFLAFVFFYILVKYNFILKSYLILMHISSQGLIFYTLYPWFIWEYCACFVGRWSRRLLLEWGLEKMLWN